MKKEPTIKEVIAKKKKAMDEENSKKLESNSSDTGDSINEISTEDLFDALIKRVKDERAEIIINKAKKEYKNLADRITPNAARSEIGKLLTNLVESKLIAAKGVTRIPKK